jgi:hypothetical protein
MDPLRHPSTQKRRKASDRKDEDEHVVEVKRWKRTESLLVCASLLLLVHSELFEVEPLSSVSFVQRLSAALFGDVQVVGEVEARINVWPMLLQIQGL